MKAGGSKAADGRVRAWSMYSWANHGWETTVATVLIGPWLLALAKHGRSDRSILVSVGSLHLRAESLPSAVLTGGALIQVLVLPGFGATADRRADPHRLLALTCLVGSVFACLIAVSAGGEWVLGAVLYLIGTVAFGASNVVNNSYLPRIAGRRERDDVSARGFAFGYVGGGLLLAANLLLLSVHSHLGLSKPTAVRICFCSAGAWWAGFGLRAARGLASAPPARGTAPSGVRLRSRLRAEVAEINRRPQARRYLIAYLLFSDAISAVIGLSSTFITHELFGDSASRAATFLFALILMIQFIAVGGALAFGRLAARMGAKQALLASLGVWCAVIVYAYVALTSKLDAVIAGVAIGLVLGGSQALARSLWSQLVPAGREATWFAVYQVATGGTAWIAPLIFTVVVNVTGSFRQAILSLLILFVAGGALLAATDLRGTLAARPAEQ